MADAIFHVTDHIAAQDFTFLEEYRGKDYSTRMLQVNS